MPTSLIGNNMQIQVTGRPPTCWGGRDEDMRWVTMYRNGDPPALLWGLKMSLEGRLETRTQDPVSTDTKGHVDTSTWKPVHGRPQHPPRGRGHPRLPADGRARGVWQSPVWVPVPVTQGGT